MEQDIDAGDAAYQLIGKKENSLKTKFAIAEIEKILERGTKQVENHGIVITFRTIPTNKRNSNATSKGLIDLGLILELRMLGLD